MTCEEDRGDSCSFNRPASTDSPDSEFTHRADPSEFLHFDPNSDLTIEHKSALYRDLVSLIRDNFDFDDALQNKTVSFLKALEPQPFQRSIADRLITQLVPTSDGSPAAFIDSFCVLLSSLHSTIVAATLSFLQATFSFSTEAHRVLLLQTDFVAKLIAKLQPQSLPLSGNEASFTVLNTILLVSMRLMNSSTLRILGNAGPSDLHNRCNLIFQRVLQPSSQYLSFLCRNHYLLTSRFHTFRFAVLVDTLLEISPYHRPTLDFVLASPIVMTWSSCVSFDEHFLHFYDSLAHICSSLEEWKKQDPVVGQSRQRMTRALCSEGFEDTIEHFLVHNTFDEDSQALVGFCCSILRFLGSNVR
ncbi:hypothetical protein BLNAU_6086 [Blattamonas nauphoetae]|uniref:Uncharacterized protein n=1 Tax=Blattamonas nauphoetae TaxID=2049346 RepID=A0ABQ9Y525_9EUKA|nr:hypothetical protein BLNAU_6086 [Blattamonas nauphoetae]